MATVGHLSGDRMKTRNWVAKHARTFNKAKVFRDRKKYYRKENWREK